MTTATDVQAVKAIVARLPEHDDSYGMFDAPAEAISYIDKLYEDR